ncbi:hypothetical protein ACH5RR_015329 [Cinchona calisaya]|uniref:Uncharacterized protein n=1 Tax=Cinchona calisaya TaxID=153742 RepID=A0ABD2ZWA8_9GENT
MSSSHVLDDMDESSHLIKMIMAKLYAGNGNSNKCDPYSYDCIKECFVYFQFPIEKSQMASNASNSDAPANESNKGKDPQPISSGGLGIIRGAGALLLQLLLPLSELRKKPLLAKSTDFLKPRPVKQLWNKKKVILSELQGKLQKESVELVKLETLHYDKIDQVKQECRQLADNLQSKQTKINGVGAELNSTQVDLVQSPS